MSNTLTKLLAGVAVVVTTSTTGALAKEAPKTDKLISDGNTLIEEAFTPDKAYGLKNRFSDLEYKATKRATFLAIEELIPEVEKDINAWEKQRSNAWTTDTLKKTPPLPQSANIKRLQGLLGLKGKAQDGAFGVKTSTRLALAATRSVRGYGVNDPSFLDIKSPPHLSELIKEQAPTNYAEYLEKRLTQAENFEQFLIKESLGESGKKVRAVRAGFQHCAEKQLITDKDKFIEGIVKDFDSTGNINEAVSACEEVLKIASPRQRENLLTGLQKSLKTDIETTRSALKETAEKEQLQSLIEKYGTPSGTPSLPTPTP